MLRSLFFRLLGAFALVILVLAIAAVILGNRATAGQFQLYTDRTGQLWAEEIAPTLASYYARTGSWQGVETTLNNPMGMMGSAGGMMSDGGMMGGAPSGQAADMWSMMGERVLLVDASGRVVSDSAGAPGGSMVGKQLPTAQAASGTAVVVGSQRVGTVIVASSVIESSSPAGQFLASVNRSILLAVLIAGIIALALGSLLFYQITAPVRDLKAAAHAIAAGDLSRRVAVRSSDELGDLGRTFNVMAENLERSEAQRRQMVADVAHELRTPLSVMQANLEAMQDGVLPLDAEQVDALHDETLLLARMVADLRLISLAEAGQLRLDFEGVDLGDLIEKSVARLQPKAGEGQIELRTETEGVPLVRADAGRLQQVVANLVGNALRYTPPGGSITVRASREDSKSVCVSVTDTGTGIGSEDLPHVFDRFYRADKSRTRSSGGSGLGLAIVRYIVEAHGGRVWAESPIFSAGEGAGYGTRISFTLPI